MVVAGAALVVSVVAVLPASAQIVGTTTTTSTTSQSTVTILPSTTTSLPDGTSTSLFETTTTEASSTTTATPAVTIPRTTTTARLEEPVGPAQMPTTTSTIAPEGGDEGLSTGTVVLLIITGLLLIAGVLSLATWRYWRSTAPTARPLADSTFVGHG